MIVPTLLALSLLQADAKPAMLSRVFAPNQKYTYDVKSHLQLENRQRGLDTFMPEDFDMNYTFTAEVQQSKADGIVVLHYQRPTMTQIQGETWNSQPQSKVDKVNLDYLLTVSPINEILETIEQKKPAAKIPPKKAKWMTGITVQGGNPIGQFIGEMYRLSLFIGPVDSALDFAPKLPFTEVKPGDTWKRTIGYQPQKLKDKDGKSVVQRLDYTYTYRGPVQVNGKTFQRVTADLDLKTDLAEWAKQFMPEGDASDGPQLSKLPLNLKGTIEFDLDPKTFNTVAARASSEGGFQVFLSDAPKDPLFETRLRGTTTMSLRSIAMVSAKKPQ
ncbi:MAG: hypothetical protein QOJ65_848 [Fimbriimonadaceae bacterium]|nr:hypothetical protein [Fimbriimonadaceae bacterium]